ncbi:hypothetical protein KVV02_006922 [Mortierella alpina]|uniref:Uncharacterized protein n=1 Tax=Mortierella alpina TaxID=64518 RepID=A0A9P8A223_MORAP|nr:hypothetical protein KVV02_006922 [Mortierella alpina]
MNPPCGNSHCTCGANCGCGESKCQCGKAQSSSSSSGAQCNCKSGTGEKCVCAGKCDCAAKKGCGCGDCPCEGSHGGECKCDKSCKCAQKGGKKDCGCSSRLMVVRRRSRASRATTVRDEAEEQIQETAPIVVDTDEGFDDDDEYQPNPEVEEAIDEELEYLEEEDIIANLPKSDQAQEQQEQEQHRKDLHEILDLESPEEEAKMVQEDEREIAVGGSRRRDTGTGGETASTSRARSRSVSRSSNGKNNNSKNNYGDDDQSAHAKRSHAGHIGASAKVGYVDSETAMTRAKYKVQGGLAGMTPFSSEPMEPPSSPPSTPTPSMLERTEGGPKFELGSDLWQTVFTYLYPSQLTAPAGVSKDWRKRIYHLPVWQKICEASGLTLPGNHIGTYGYEKPNYFRLAHENADSICEQCYKLCRPSGSYRALPVRPVDETVPTEIHMCRDCRVDYYIESPEPVPEDVAPYQDGEYTITPRMTKGEAMKTYLLTNSDIMSLPYEMGRNPYFRHNSPMYLFEEQHVLRLARQVHGGDIGIAAARADSEYTGRKVSEPQDDVIKTRRNLLRSLLHEKGLVLPEHSAICHIYIDKGLGDSVEIVKELETVDWFHRCTSYDPSLEKAHLKQVKRRPRITRRRDTRPEGETRMSRGLGEVDALDKSIQEETMTEEEEEKDDQHKMDALDDWLQHRLEQGLYQSYKLDPEGPEKPPEGVWPLLDRIDVGHKMLEFAAEKVYSAMEKQRHFIRWEGLRKFALNKNQVRMMVDAVDPNLSRVSEMTKRKRRRVEGGQEQGEFPEEPQLSTLLEHDFGPMWYVQVLEEAKKRAESRLF